jgi:tetratricopeptide (TPR) repeat protein
LAILASALVLGALIIGAVVIAVVSQNEGLKQSVQPFPRDMREYIAGIRDRTAAIRGLAPNPDITEGYISRNALRQYVEEHSPGLTAEERLRIQRLAEIYVLLHMIEPDYDLHELFTQASTDSLSGFYVPNEKLLVTVGKPMKGNRLDELILAHEYTHSFQDKAFDFARLSELEETEQSEYDLTVPCVYEGDASVAAERYMAATYGEDWFDELPDTLPSAQPTRDGDGPSIPIALARYFAFRYLQCTFFVEAILEEGNWEGVNGLYSRVPLTSEQVIHPEKYLADERPSSLKARDLSGTLGEEWQRVELDMFGEFDVYNYLASFLTNNRAAREAAAGWGGGWVALYASRIDPADDFVHLSLDWDTDTEFRQFREEYSRALRGANFDQLADPFDAPGWSWSDDREVGMAFWSPPDKRVEIVVGREQESIFKAFLGLPETAAQFWLLGNRSYVRKEWQQAIDFYSRAVDLDPGQVGAWHFRGYIHYMAGNYREALIDFSRSVELEPTNADFVRRRGETHFYLGNYQAAIDDLTRSIEHWRGLGFARSPASSVGSAYYYRGLAYASMGLIGEAVLDLEESLPFEARAVPSSAPLPFTAEPIPIEQIQEKLTELRGKALTR